MIVRRISHVAIAVRDLEAQVALYRDVLGFELIARETVEDQQVNVALLRVGESHIELIEPTNDDSPVARHIARQGPGLHHIAYEVDDIAETVEEAKQRNLSLIDQQPRVGAGGARIAFVHPLSTRGVLTEFCQSASAASAADVTPEDE